MISGARWPRTELTLERRTSVHGASHPRTFDSGAAVARDLLEAGRYSEAAARMSTVWAQSCDTLGDNDRNTLTALLLLGVAERCAGRPDVSRGAYPLREDRPDPRVRRGQQRCPGQPYQPGP